jgi:hypothetical protein
LAKPLLEKVATKGVSPLQPYGLVGDTFVLILRIADKKAAATFGGGSGFT